MLAKLIILHQNVLRQVYTQFLLMKKTGIQARQPTTPDKPIKLRKTVRRDYEYIRHGTQTLLAGMNVVTGKIIPLVSETRTEQDFAKWLNLCIFLIA